MKTNPRRFNFASRLGRATATISLAATLVLIGGRARAQNYLAVTLVPDHVYVLRGASVRHGDLVAVEPSALFFFGPIRPPVAIVARAVLGLGGSGLGIGLAVDPVTPCPSEAPSRQGDDLPMWPIFSLEARVERMYAWTSWRWATYVGPQLSLSVVAFKASVGWMVDVSDQTNQHLQLGFGAGF